jgi:small-conductance mechanosensitive channel
LLQSEPGRQFRIEVNADSFVQLDEEAEKQSATEFLQVMGGFIQQVMPLAQMNPKMGPMVAEMVNFAARTFKAGRTLEPAIEEAMASLEGPNIAQQQQQLQQQAQQLEGQKKQAQEDMQREKQAFQQEKNMFNAEKQLMGKDLDLSKRENTLMVKEAINKMQTGLPS